VSARTLLREHPGASAGAGLVAFSVLLVLWAQTRPGFDPFGWLVWGHQTLHLNLNTNGAPSWKPLPYLFTVPYAITGHYAMWLWLFTSVAISLSGVIFAGRIAYRLTGPSPQRPYARWVAAVSAGLALLGITDYVHYILSAQSDTMIVALCLGAIDCHLSGRHRIAFVLAVLASLGRPEVWPFTGLYALWAWRAIPQMRALIAAGLVVIPLLWFGIPALTANSFFVAGNLALHSGRALHGNKVLGTIDRFIQLHAAPIWIAALLSVALAIWRRDRATLVLAGGVAAWVVIEIAFALHGWPALNRYMFEAAGVTVVVAAVGVGRLLAGVPGADGRPGIPNWAGIAVVALIALTLVPTAVTRVRTEHQDLFHERARTRQINRLQGVIARLGGASAILACATPSSQLSFQSILAWETNLNVGQVGYHPARDLRRHRPVVLFRPVGFGWHVHPYHTAPALQSQCHHLVARTPVS
jgi:hypothetical protein